MFVPISCYKSVFMTGWNFKFQLFAEFVYYLKGEKKLTEKDAARMTINERLYHADLLTDFEESLSQRNKLKLESVLEKVFVSKEDIAFVVNQYLKKDK